MSPGWGTLRTKLNIFGTLHNNRTVINRKPPSRVTQRKMLRRDGWELGHAARQRIMYRSRGLSAASCSAGDDELLTFCLRTSIPRRRAVDTKSRYEQKVSTFSADLRAGIRLSGPAARHRTRLSGLAWQRRGAGLSGRHLVCW